VDMYEGIMTTRAIRRQTGEPVSDEEIVACLRAAAQAPSGGNIQPYQFLVVRDPDKKRAIGEVYRKAHTRYEAAVSKVTPPAKSPEHDAARKKSKAAAKHLREHIGESEALVLLLMPKISMNVSDEDGEMDAGPTYASVYPAAAYFLLAARSMDIATVLTTVIRVNEDECREICDIPDRFEIAALIPVGRPKGKWGVAPRRPLEQITHWDTYGNRRDYEGAE
jgi:nitroreductase